MGLFNENSRMKDILKNDKAKEIIEKYLPGALANPGIKIAMMINPSIKQALGYRKQINMSDETANAFVAELFAIE